MEAHFSRDLSGVRIHDDAGARASAHAERAAAYTVGSHIFLGDSFAPGSRRQRHLLAHELAHVAQQSSGTPKAASPAAAEGEADAAASAWGRGIKAPRPSVRSAQVPMHQGSGEFRVAQARIDREAREKYSELAGRLLEVQLKADALQPAMTGDANLASQQQMLVEHLEAMTRLLQEAGGGDLVDASVFPAIEAGIDAGGLAADLMYLDRLNAAGGQATVSRAGVNRGLAFAWGVMRQVQADPLWPVTHRADADEWLRTAAFHRDTVKDFTSTAAVLKAGVTAAQLADLAVTAPQLLASGKTALANLAKWLTEGGGGPGALGAVASGGRMAIVVTSGGRTLVLTAAEIEALVQAGVLSGRALVLYNMATRGGGTGGPAGSGKRAAPKPKIEPKQTEPASSDTAKKKRSGKGGGERVDPIRQKAEPLKDLPGQTAARRALEDDMNALLEGKATVRTTKIQRTEAGLQQAVEVTPEGAARVMDVEFQVATKNGIKFNGDGYEHLGPKAFRFQEHKQVLTIWEGSYHSTEKARFGLKAMLQRHLDAAVELDGTACKGFSYTTNDRRLYELLEELVEEVGGGKKLFPKFRPQGLEALPD
jgi:uncharacterized protein DUF4157